MVIQMQQAEKVLGRKKKEMKTSVKGQQGQNFKRLWKKR